MMVLSITHQHKLLFLSNQERQLNRIYNKSSTWRKASLWLSVHASIFKELGTVILNNGFGNKNEDAKHSVHL